MTIDEIIAQIVAYLKTLPDGTEIATSDALKASCGFDFDPNGEYLVGNTPGGLRVAHKTVWHVFPRSSLLHTSGTPAESVDSSGVLFFV